MQVAFQIAVILFLAFTNVHNINAEEVHEYQTMFEAEGGELSMLKEKVSMLEASLSELQKNQYNDASSGSSVSRLNATTIAQMEEIREQIRGLRGEVEQIQFDNARINEKMIKMAADFEHRISELAKKTSSASKHDDIFEEIDESLDNDLILQQNDAKASKNRRNAEKKMKERPGGEVALLVREKEMQKLYDEAYDLLKGKKMKEALEKFRTFVSEYPDTDLAGNAYYWVGEIYFQKKSFENSAIEYLKGYQANIRGSRAADNLLKLGMSLANLEKRKEACTTYMKLEKEFPNTTNMIKKKNVSEMKKLRCKS